MGAAGSLDANNRPNGFRTGSAIFANARRGRPNTLAARSQAANRSAGKKEATPDATVFKVTLKPFECMLLKSL